MKKHSADNKNERRRLIITIVFAVFAASISGFSFFLMQSRVPNMHVIFYLVLGLSAILITFLILWTLGASERYSQLAAVLRRCYVVCLTLGLAGFLTFQGLILSAAHTEEADVDALIVLGAGLRNGAPSLVLRTRLNAAIAYHEKQGDIPIIVSGGLGEGETVTEAEAMFRYLSTRGVDESMIWRENASTNTQENLAFSLALMEDNGLDIETARVAVVSNEFHLYRAKLIAGKAGLDAVGVAAATPGVYLRVLYSFREAFALASEVLL